MANIVKVQETKLFSAQASDAQFLKSLRAGSVSDQDAASRKNEYGKLFSKYENMKEAYKMFSGVTEMPLLSNQYFNATVASFVRSFAGFLSIERDMAEPTALLWFDDVLGVVDERVVLPNVGQENLSDIESTIAFEDVTISTAAIELSTGKVIVPGSIKGTVVKADGTGATDFVDDAHGNILAAPGILTASSINYKTGAINFTVAAAYAGGKYTIKAASDAPGTPVYGTVANDQKNRFKLDMKNILVQSEADMLIGESNLVAMAQANKSLGQNPMQVLGAKLVELYTKLINNQLVGAVKAAATDTYTIDASGWSTQYYDYSSSLNAFSAEQVNVDTALAAKSVKGVEATCYVCGKGAGNWFRKLRATGEFREEKGSTYVNDLLGYFHDIPVLRHIGVADNEYYAVHKTPGGELAPVMFGQYLPLTWTPSIGSYSNPTQVANGVFFQNGTRPICAELVQRVVIQTV
jgi:hypothetical protein